MRVEVLLFGKVAVVEHGRWHHKDKLFERFLNSYLYKDEIGYHPDIDWHLARVMAQRYHGEILTPHPPPSSEYPERIY